MKTPKNLIKRLIANQRGVIAISFALTFGVMLTGTFVSIDIIRHNLAQTRIQNALDTAVISAGRRLSEHKPVKGGKPGEAWGNDAYNYFNANFPSGFLGVELKREQVHINYIEDRVGDRGQYLSAQRIEMSVTGGLPLLSTGFLSGTSMGLAASNQAIRRTRNDLEVVLALDNTGSMNERDGGSKTRMQILKESSKDLINTIMEASSFSDQTDGDTINGAYIGLVPFTDSVNVGSIPSAKGWLEYPPQMENYINNIWAKSSSSGCIAEPRPESGQWSNNRKLPTQALSPSAKFRPMFSTYSTSWTPSSLPDYAYLVRHPDITDGVSIQSTNSNRDYSVNINPEKSWTTTANNAPQAFHINMARESEYCTTSKTYFLTKEQTTLISAIDKMEPYGGTGVPTGLMWAWRMLRTEWRGAAGWGDPDLPRDSNPKLRKVIVLLSDGDNAPVVGRANLSLSGSGNYNYNVNYAYKACSVYKYSTSWWGNKTIVGCESYGNETIKRTDIYTDTKNVNQASTCSYGRPSNSFCQCPIDGLLISDPLSFTPSNYANNCTNADTDIGYGTTTQTGRGRLTSTALDNYQEALCSAIKASDDKITIYTLILGKDVKNSRSREIMRNCASSPDHFFDVTIASELPEAFAAIAGALTELRLTQ